MRLTVGLDDLGGIFLAKRFYDSVQGYDATGTHVNSQLVLSTGRSMLQYLIQMVLGGDLASNGLTRATGCHRRGEVCIALGGQ